jgi:hypothetical protein
MIEHKLSNKTKSATVAEPKIFLQLSRPLLWFRPLQIVSIRQSRQIYVMCFWPSDRGTQGPRDIISALNRGGDGACPAHSMAAAAPGVCPAHSAAMASAPPGPPGLPNVLQNRHRYIERNSGCKCVNGVQHDLGDVHVPAWQNRRRRWRW